MVGCVEDETIILIMSSLPATLKCDGQRVISKLMLHLSSSGLMLVFCN